MRVWFHWPFVLVPFPTPLELPKPSMATPFVYMQPRVTRGLQHTTAAREGPLAYSWTYGPKNINTHNYYGGHTRVWSFKNI